MSAFGGKADVRELPSECLLIAKSGHSAAILTIVESGQLTRFHLLPLPLPLLPPLPEPPLPEEPPLPDAPSLELVTGRRDLGGRETNLSERASRWDR